MRMLKEVVYQDNDVDEHEYHKDENGQIIKTKKVNKIVSKDLKGTEVENEIVD